MSLILDALRIKKEGIHLEASGLVVHSERWHKSLVSRKGLMLGFSLMLFGGAVVLGLKYYRDHKESLSIVSQSAALAPAPIVAIGVPAKPTLTSQVSHNYKLGNYRENRQLLAEALAQDPDSSQLLNLTGLNSLKLGNYDEAERSFTRALAINNACAECYNNLGYLLTLKSDAKNAENNFKKSIAINADYADPYFNLAVLYQKYGNDGQAKTFFEHYLKKSPDKNTQLAMDTEAYVEGEE